MWRSAGTRTAACALVMGLTIVTAGGCGGADYADDDVASGPSPSLVTVVTTSGPGDVATLDDTNLVMVRTLPASALSAERLEPAGAATTPDGGSIDLATVRVGSEGARAGAAQWEYVSPADNGWRVWQPVAVQQALADAGAGASVGSVETVDWPDACLGAAGFDEACAAVITPGFLVVIERGGGSVRYHASRTGEFRVAPAVP